MRKLWEYLQFESKQINFPWIVAGDFNGIIHIFDRIGRDEVNFKLGDDLSRCFQQSALIEA